MTVDSPSFDDPELQARLAQWRASDEAIGGFVTIVSQRARIIELESEVDRLVERSQGWELEAIHLQSVIAENAAAARSAEAARVAAAGQRTGLRRWIR